MKCPYCGKEMRLGQICADNLLSWTPDGESSSGVTRWSERAFISMNEQKVVRLEIDNGNDIEVIEIDRNNPFAIVLPVNTGNVTFYDENGKIVDYCSQSL